NFPDLNHHQHPVNMNQALVPLQKISVPGLRMMWKIQPNSLTDQFSQEKALLNNSQVSVKSSMQQGLKSVVS
ncbi:hypothetical protein XENOCAPTIV_019827, partial [Xenoophorus captivus]